MPGCFERRTKMQTTGSTRSFAIKATKSERYRHIDRKTTTMVTHYSSFTLSSSISTGVRSITQQVDCTQTCLALE